MGGGGGRAGRWGGGVLFGAGPCRLPLQAASTDSSVSAPAGTCGRHTLMGAARARAAPASTRRRARSDAMAEGAERGGSTRCRAYLLLTRAEATPAAVFARECGGDLNQRSFGAWVRVDGWPKRDIKRC